MTKIANLGLIVFSVLFVLSIAVLFRGIRLQRRADVRIDGYGRWDTLGYTKRGRR